MQPHHCDIDGRFSESIFKTAAKLNHLAVLLNDSLNLRISHRIRVKQANQISFMQNTPSVEQMFLAIAERRVHND
ncbi:hypothetical protein SDC9_129542 [bioreactor metagenome]|uniref:Uncharacterized protein n=1 Tax=bioreactor metagenome TaxID=1076179 RepID=A0A645D034_9ZZZZ